MPSQVVRLPRFGQIPAKGNPIGLTYLFKLGPGGDRGLTFGRSRAGGIPLGKIPGYWSCPYAGTITGVMLNTDRGGYTVRFWKTVSGRSPIADDNISINGYTIAPPDTHQEFFSVSDFLFVDVLPGDTFAVEVVSLKPPIPTDIAGNVVIIKIDEEAT
jgi:hypothetical protein